MIRKEIIASFSVYDILVSIRRLHRAAPEAVKVPEG